MQFSRLSLNNYCQMALRGRPRHPGVLTPREWDVYKLLKRGLTNEQIADRLGITLDGAKYHVSSILSKLGASSRVEASRMRPVEAVPAGWRSWGWLLTLGKAAGVAMAAGTIVGAGVFGYSAFFKGAAEESIDDVARTSVEASGLINNAGGELQETGDSSAAPTPAGPGDRGGAAIIGDAGGPGSSTNDGGGTAPAPASVASTTPTPTKPGATPCVGCNPPPAPTSGSGPTGTPGSSGTPAATAKPTPRPTPTPTATPTAAPTPAPTEHDVASPPATETPEPTETPKPSETPQPTETPHGSETPEPSGIEDHGAS